MTIPLAYLSRSTQASLARCGSPLVLVDHGGAPHHVRWRCRSRYCPECAQRRAQRVYCAISAAVDVRRPWLVTLTQPAARGRTEAQLRERLATHRDLWRRATRRLRLWRSAVRRGADALEQRAIVPPPSRYGRPHPEYASTWSDARGWSAAAAEGDWAWLWALEVTPGRVGWHVHRHVMTPTRALAELISAAWQAAAAELGEVERGRWVRTDLRQAEPRDDDDTRHHGASYLASYCSGAKDLDALGNLLGEARHEATRAYVRVTYRLRRYDAAGAWRPLGLSAGRDSGRLVVGVLTDQWEVWRTDHPDLYAGLSAEDARAVLASEPPEVRERWRDLWRRSSSAWRLWPAWTTHRTCGGPPPD